MAPYCLVSPQYCKLLEPTGQGSRLEGGRGAGPGQGYPFHCPLAFYSKASVSLGAMRMHWLFRILAVLLVFVPPALATVQVSSVKVKVGSGGKKGMELLRRAEQDGQSTGRWSPPGRLGAPSAPSSHQLRRALLSPGATQKRPNSQSTSLSPSQGR